MDICIDNLDIDKITIQTLNIMSYLKDYLENEWKIKKKDNCFILTNKNTKIYTLDNLIVSSHSISDNKEKYILAFIYNGLNNGWTIKKQKNEYIFSKKHEGKKEIFSDSYINTFLKENFNFNLIK
jgi:hypothetical protein